MAMKDISDAEVCVAYAAAKIENDKRNALRRQEGRGIFDPLPEHLLFVNPYDYLAEWTGQSVKVCYRCMERAASRGFIEYGVSLRTGWLTDKGRTLLQETSAKLAAERSTQQDQPQEAAHG